MPHVQDLAGVLDHSLLHPTLNEIDLIKGLELAMEFETASVCIKPCGLKLGRRYLQGSKVALGTVIGFPQGTSSPEVKLYETKWALDQGAQELDMVINIGKALSSDYEYIQNEIKMIHQETRNHGALLKVIFENDFLPSDSIKIKLCEICSQLKVDYIKTSTGFGFTKQPNNYYLYQGAVDSDIILMRKNSSPDMKIKAAGGVRTLDRLLHVLSLGVSRVGTSATAAILTEAAERETGSFT